MILKWIRFAFTSIFQGLSVWLLEEWWCSHPIRRVSSHLSSPWSQEYSSHSSGILFWNSTWNWEKEHKGIAVNNIIHKLIKYYCQQRHQRWEIVINFFQELQLIGDFWWRLILLLSFFPHGTYLLLKQQSCLQFRENILSVALTKNGSFTKMLSPELL